MKKINRWTILITSCLINLCIGSMYAWSALSAPMAVELGVENLSIVFSVANSVGFISMIIGGLLNDRFGPRWVIFGGGLMFGIGMFSSGYAQSPGYLIISYGLFVGLGLSFVYGCTISNTIKFFPDKRGMAGGMTTASYGISSVIFAPLAMQLSSAFGARNTFHILGAVFLVIICAGAFIIQKCPDQPAAETKISTDKTPGHMVRMPVFYVMIVMLTAGGTFGMMIISNARGLAVDMVQASPALATMVVSVLCLFNTAGRLIAGSLSDKLGRINTLTIALFIALAGLILLITSEKTVSVPLFITGVVLIGVCFGTFMGVFPGFATDVFGQKYNTVNYGIMWVGFSASGMLGPMILVRIHNASGIYSGAFIAAIVIAVLGLLMTVIFRRLRK